MVNTRLLLTGGGGAIGVHVLAHLMHNTDWDLVLTDSFRPEQKGRFDRIARVCRDHPQWRNRIRIVPHDLTAPFSLMEIKQIGDVRYIINLASLSDVGDSIDSPCWFIRNNTEIMLTVLEYVRALKPEVFIHFSTDEVYGPAPAFSSGHLEWSSILPSNPYSASKACQEAMAVAWWRSYGIPLIVTNTMNNFGEMQAPSKFPAMIQRNLKLGIPTKVHASASGEMGTRYYIHARNTADAVLFILKNVKPVIHSSGSMDRPTRLNIVGDQQVSNLDLVKIISSMMNKDPNYEIVHFHESNPGHDLHYGLDGSALKLLGWKSPVPFEKSLQNTIDWQMRNPEWIE